MGKALERAIVGSLIGTAVADAIGLPSEGASRKRLAKIYGTIDDHKFLFGKGMMSDDTEHALLAAQALIVSGGDPASFGKELARRLRIWLAFIPGGIGWATMRGILKSCFGVPPEKSGVFSAGNGPAMRAPILGVCFGDDPKQLRKLVRISTRITHTDLKAEYGSLAVAIAAHMAFNQGTDVSGKEFLKRLQNELGKDGKELLVMLRKAVKSAEKGESTFDYWKRIGPEKGPSGYMYHTMPVVIHAWLLHQDDYKKAVMEVVHLGGDTDTTAAILGGIVGAAVGTKGIPKKWRSNMWEWPRSMPWIEGLGKRLAKSMEKGKPGQQMPLEWWKLPPRNFIFFWVLIFHQFRRVLPPY